MLDRLTSADFSALLQQTFRLSYHPQAAPLDLALVEVSEWGEPPQPGGRRPFSLLFRGPREPLLPQRIYTLEHPQTGVLEIFLVPLGPDDTGQVYQAVFS